MDLVETILYPGAFEIRDQIGEDIQEFREQLSKQSERLTELREKKRTDPGEQHLFCSMRYFTNLPAVW